MREAVDGEQWTVAGGLTCARGSALIAESGKAAAAMAAPNFDRLAPIYRWMEWASFGPFLWWSRCAFLSEMGERRQALVMGDGDGRFTARLLAAHPDVRVEAVDASAAMLRALLRRAGRNAARVSARCGDAREWRPRGAGFDLVVTHFFLDCLTTAEVRRLAERVRGAVQPCAVWVVSEFAVPEGWFGRLVARPLVWWLYWAFGVLTGLGLRRLPEYAEALRSAGFGMLKRKTWLGGLLVSEVWTVADRGL